MSQPSNHGSWLWDQMTNNNNLTITLATISLTILAILWRKFALSMSSNGSPPLPPGPISLPLVGYLPFLTRDLHKQLTAMADTYGPVFKFYIGSKLFVVMNTPDVAKEVVRNQDEAFAHHEITIASSIFTYGGQDIAFSNDAQWRALRKILVHEVLSNKNLEATYFIRREEMRKTVHNVYSKIGDLVNIGEISFLTSANILTKMVWENAAMTGTKDSDLGVELQTVSMKALEIFGRLNLSDFFPFLARFDLQGVVRDIKMQQNKLDRVFASIIEDRIAYNSNRSEGGVEFEEKNDFLQTLLELKDKEDATSLTMNQIKSLLVDIMIGGTETTATVVEWVMAEIIYNEEVMKRVQQELEETVGIDNIVDESHLPKLQYLEAAIKETLRLHPISPLLVPRAPSKDCIVNGYTIPKGCNVFVNVWSIQRNPQYWDNPLDFNPERFLTSEGTKKWDLKGTNLKFMPFGSGRRVCPGIPLADKMQTYILASLLHSFNWTLPKGEQHDLCDKYGVALKKRKPLVVIPSQRFVDISLYV